MIEDPIYSNIMLENHLNTIKKNRLNRIIETDINNRVEQVRITQDFIQIIKLF